jgi:hypothetical protein
MRLNRTRTRYRRDPAAVAVNARAYAQQKEREAAHFTDDKRAATAYREAAAAYLVAADADLEAGDKKAAMRSNKLAAQAKEYAEQASATSDEELLLFIENEESLYRQKDAFLMNMYKKMRKGTYDPIQGRKLWLHFVERGARVYASEYMFETRPWNKIFPKRERELAAVEIERRERANLERGEYEKYPPLSSRRDPSARRRMTRRRR